MRKLLSALVLLALVIVMMPAQVARADNVHPQAGKKKRCIALSARPSSAGKPS